MSEARDILGHVVTERQSFTGDVVTNLRTGKQLTVEIEEIADIELNTEMGRDAREAVLIHVNRADVDDQSMKLNDRLKLGTVTFIALRRKDNPMSPQVEFGCMKSTANDK